MSLSQHTTTARNNALRSYVERHSGLVIGISIGFAAASCFGLVLLFGVYASLGGTSDSAVALGLSLWLAFNGWAIKRFMTSLRRRAEAESERLRFDRFKPLQTG